LASYSNQEENLKKIVIDPITRIEGHLKLTIFTENGIVKEAQSSGMLFRGIEIILQGRDPRDAQRYTQRICGVCPTSHSIAAALNLDSAFNITDKIPDNGRIVRNLILGAAHIADHILHFYLLVALDYVDIARVAKYEGNDATLISIKHFIERNQLAPFIPRYEGDYRLPDDLNLRLVAHYIKALEMRRKAQEMLTIFGGKMPHNMAVIPGGVTENVTTDKIASFLWRLNELRDFINDFYLLDVLDIGRLYPDYFEIGAGCGNLLSYGNFDLNGKSTDLTTRERLFKQGTISTDLKWSPLEIDKVIEHVKYSWYPDSSTGRHPTYGQTEPVPDKKQSYSWIKAPRYNDRVYEVGPLARLLVTYAKGEPAVRKIVESILSELNVPISAMFSVLGRHIARVIYTKVVANNMADWVLQLKPGEPTSIDYEMPEEGRGMGLVEAARGALGHWIEIKGGKIANYQAVVPSTWNLSPKDDVGRPGPVEQAIIGVKIKDESNPFEIIRIVRSFDPCIACAVHLLTLKGRKIGEFRVV
jgi:hydrogenase large subunit